MIMRVNSNKDLNFNYNLYNIILGFKFLEVVPKKFIKYILLSRNPQKKRFFFEKLGIVSIPAKINNTNREWVWLHANAIGEVSACQPLIRLIKTRYPSKRILLTTSNFSADSKAHELKIADKVIFFPYDIPFIVKRFLKIFNLACVIIIECDIWPNFIRICKQNKIPIVVASGVYTNDSCRSLGLRHLYNYRFRFTWEVFKNIDFFSMQTEVDVNKLRSDFKDITNTYVGGNLKFSSLDATAPLNDKPNYAALFNIKPDERVFIAGNVHKAESSDVINAFMQVKNELPEAVMILAPRFIHEVKDVEEVLKNKRLNYVRRTAIGNKQKRYQESIILLDTMGELAKVYPLAKVAFVGGSLAYLGEMFGGHNIIEPAQFGVPVIFGQHMHNFKHLADLFLREKLATQVKDAAELGAAIKDLIKDDKAREFTRSKIRDIFTEYGDAAEKTFSFLSPFLDNVHSSAGNLPCCEACTGRDYKPIIGQGQYRILRCKNCGLVCSNPLPEIRDLRVFYDNFSFNQFESEFSGENLEIGKFVLGRQLAILRRYGAELDNGNFLDIGCGSGYYVYGAKENGLNAEGIDLDAHAVEFGKQNFGIDISAKELRECNFPDNRFHLINSRQLIEHLIDPLDFLKEVRRILRPRGFLVLETPNTDSLEHILKLYFLDTFKKNKADGGANKMRFKEVIRVIRREWGFVDPPRHIFGFNEHNLKLLCEKAGFKCIKIIKAMTGHRVYYPLSKGHRKFVLKARREALKRLLNSSLPKFLVYVLIFMPAMFTLKVFIYLANNGSHLVIYAKKE